MKIMLLKIKELVVGYSSAHARGFSGLAGSPALCHPLSSTFLQIPGPC